jgi:uracil-DNA glycosylase
VGPYGVIGSFHPSQQNTFTGKLSQEQLVVVLRRARELAVAS